MPASFAVKSQESYLDTSFTGSRSVRANWPRIAVRLIMIIMCAAALASCKSELYTNLDQQHANRIVATLLEHGIAADRSPGKADRVSVSVDESRFAEAVEVLNDNGLPKQEFSTLGEVFKKDGLVSSPVQERAQMIFALSQELSQTVSEIDGVLSARVHLVLPENDPLRQQLVPSSASVFIRYRANAPVNELVPQVKMLITNGVAGLSYDKVSVILVPVPERTSAVRNEAEPGLYRRGGIYGLNWPLYGLAAVGVMLIAGLIVVLLRRRPRIYQLSTGPVVKSQ
jgi:type III secretion protein J